VALHIEVAFGVANEQEPNAIFDKKSKNHIPEQPAFSELALKSRIFLGKSAYSTNPSGGA
jgi:hypothetical protein